MVVRFSVEISVSDYGSHCSHFCWGLSGGCLVMVAQNYPNFRPLQLSDAMRCCKHVVLGEEGCSAVEVPIVDYSSYPGVVVDSSGSPSYNSVFVVGPSAF